MLNEKALEAAMDADLDRMWADAGEKDKPDAVSRQAFKDDNREEYVCTITAYLKALEAA